MNRVGMIIVAAAMLIGVATAVVARQSSAPATAAVRFMAIDVMLDPQGAPLAAYQIEFVCDPSRVKLVGVEGGEHSAFAQAPYYDPSALNHNRIIIAALNAGDDLPKSKTRIARLHLQMTGEGQPDWSAKLIVAAARDEHAIENASVTLGTSEGVSK